MLLIPASRTRSIPATLSLGAIGALLTAYARPEYFLTFLLLLMVLIGGMILKKEWRPRHLLFDFGAISLAGTVIIKIVGLPISSYRSLCAFGQHFALRWISSTGSALNPWDDWQAIVGQSFGPVHGMLDVVRNNPHLFANHIEQNIIGLANNFAMLCPTYLFGDKVSKLAVVAAAGWIFYTHRGVALRNFHRQKAYLLIVGLFLLAGLIAIVTVYPRPHYFVAPVVLLTTSLALLFYGQPEKQESPRWPPILMISLGILALTPSPYVRAQDQDQENVRTIRIIRDMHIARPVNILDAEGGIEAFLGDNFSSVDQSEKNTGFREFLATRRIGIVIVTRDLATDIRFRGDPEWQDFLLHCEAWGFSRISVPNSDISLIVQKNLGQ